MLFKKPSAIKTGLLCIVVFAIVTGGNYYWSSQPITTQDEELIEKAMNTESDVINAKLPQYVDHAMKDGVITKSEFSKIKQIAKKEKRL